MIHQEFHITVQGDQFKWRGFCAANGIKSLHIELNNFERQLMCAARVGQINAAMIEAAGFKVIRIKHELQAEIVHVLGCDKVVEVSPEAVAAKYYECHVKLDGPFRHRLHMSSRDLFRDERWYATWRSPHSFQPRPFVDHIRSITPDSVIAGWEYEACVLDTNPELDANWVNA